MVREFVKYMKRGKDVESSYTGEVYKLVQDMEESQSTVLAVNMENWRRYELLKTWSRNHVGVTEEQEAEMRGYEETLDIKAVVPHNSIRFITPAYETKFEVKDLGNVVVNGDVRRVVYLDPYHFSFVGGMGYHICEFAELCERNGIEVKPVSGFGT